MLQPFDKILVLPLPTAEKESSEKEAAGGSSTEDLKEEETLESGFENQLLSEKIVDTRLDLLAPIVQKLRRQSRSGQRAQIIEISGAVQMPGEYPIIGEGNVSSAIALAGGFLDSSYLQRSRCVG